MKAMRMMGAAIVTITAAITFVAVVLDRADWLERGWIDTYVSSLVEFAAFFCAVIVLAIFGVTKKTVLPGITFLVLSIPTLACQAILALLVNVFDVDLLPNSYGEEWIPRGWIYWVADLGELIGGGLLLAPAVSQVTVGSEATLVEDGRSDQVAPRSAGRGVAAAVYILYLLGFFFFLPLVVGVIIAHASAGGSAGWLNSHYGYQIRTFWMGLLFLVLGSVLVVFGLAVAGLNPFVILGAITLAFWFFWTVFRCIKGLVLLTGGEPLSATDGPAT